MPISIDTLRSAWSRSGFAKSASTLTETRSLGVRTAFLCHSHDDASMVRGLLNLFQEDGWRVYVDWQDPALSEKPTRETAEKIKLTIRVMEFEIITFTNPQYKNPHGAYNPRLRGRNEEQSLCRKPTICFGTHWTRE